MKLSNEKKYPMTILGKLEKEREMEQLIKINRPEIVARIKEARELGDLSENAEYHAAKEEQSILEGRIATINNMLRFVEIIDEKITLEEKAKLEAFLAEAQVKVADFEAGVEAAKQENNKEEALLLAEKAKLEQWYANKVDELLNTVEVDAEKKTSEVVTIGKTVTFVEIGEDEEEEYTIVGSAEADPFEGKISNDSPIAKGLLEKKVGDKVKIATPGGDMEVEIVKIQ